MKPETWPNPKYPTIEDVEREATKKREEEEKKSPVYEALEKVTYYRYD